MKRIEQAPDTTNIFTKYFQSGVNYNTNKELRDLVKEVNENYYYWDKVKFLKTSEDLKPSDIWITAKFLRNNVAKFLQFGKYTFSFSMNSKFQELLHLFDLNIGGSLESKNIIPKDDKNRYLISSIMEEAIASSQIEGAMTTRKAAKEMLRKNTNPRNKSEQMILNNYLTIQKIIEWKNEDITIEKILELHRLVSFKTLDDKEDEGKFRNDNEVKVVDVIDGEVVHYPPNFEELKELMDELCYFFNNNSENFFIHPIIKGIIFHFLIGFIHPFVDGNGRTARALFYWYLLKKGYWLTEYMSISRMILKSKIQYAKAFIYTEIDDNDLGYFIDYQLRTMKLAFDSLRKYIQLKIEEKKKMTDFVKIASINPRQSLIMKWILEEPSLVFSVKEMETRLSISNQTARVDLQGLVDLGYLENIELNKKTQAYIKSKKFDEILSEKLKQT